MGDKFNAMRGRRNINEDLDVTRMLSDFQPTTVVNEPDEICIQDAFRAVFQQDLRIFATMLAYTMCGLAIFMISYLICAIVSCRKGGSLVYIAPFGYKGQHVANFMTAFVHVTALCFGVISFITGVANQLVYTYHIPFFILGAVYSFLVGVTALMIAVCHIRWERQVLALHRRLFLRFFVSAILDVVFLTVAGIVFAVSIVKPLGVLPVIMFGIELVAKSILIITSLIMTAALSRTAICHDNTNQTIPMRETYRNRDEFDDYSDLVIPDLNLNRSTVHVSTL